jgi:hypothetical protein
MVNNDFKTLIDFLNRMGPEVSGRSLSSPNAEAVAQLRRFARGACKKDEMHEVCEMLRLHPAWIRWLADRVKEARVTHSSPVAG